MQRMDRNLDNNVDKVLWWQSIGVEEMKYYLKGKYDNMYK